LNEEFFLVIERGNTIKKITLEMSMVLLVLSIVLCFAGYYQIDIRQSDSINTIIELLIIFFGIILVFYFYQCKESIYGTHRSWQYSVINLFIFIFIIIAILSYIFDINLGFWELLNKSKIESS
jgi:hypothetical protein